MKRSIHEDFSQRLSLLERIMQKSDPMNEENEFHDPVRLPEAYANRPQSAYTIARILRKTLPVLCVCFLASSAWARGVTTTDPLFSAPHLVEEDIASCEAVSENDWGIVKVTCYGTPAIAEYHERGHICAQNVYRLLFVNDREGWFRHEHTIKGWPKEWLAEECESNLPEPPPNPNY